MPKITVVKEKTGQVKYKLNLPKEWMTGLSVQAGDILLPKSIVGNELTFIFKRKAELDAEKKRLLQEQIDKLK